MSCDIQPHALNMAYNQYDLEPILSINPMVHSIYPLTSHASGTASLSNQLGRLFAEWKPENISILISNLSRYADIHAQYLSYTEYPPQMLSYIIASPTNSGPAFTVFDAAVTLLSEILKLNTIGMDNVIGSFLRFIPYATPSLNKRTLPALYTALCALTEPNKKGPHYYRLIATISRYSTTCRSAILKEIESILPKDTQSDVPDLILFADVGIPGTKDEVLSLLRHIDMYLKVKKIQQISPANAEIFQQEFHFVQAGLLLLPRIAAAVYGSDAVSADAALIPSPPPAPQYEEFQLEEIKKVLKPTSDGTDSGVGSKISDEMWKSIENAVDKLMESQKDEQTQIYGQQSTDQSKTDNSNKVDSTELYSGVRGNDYLKEMIISIIENNFEWLSKHVDVRVRQVLAFILPVLSAILISEPGSMIHKPFNASDHPKKRFSDEKSQEVEYLEIDPSYKSVKPPKIDAQSELVKAMQTILEVETIVNPDTGKQTLQSIDAIRLAPESAIITSRAFFSTLPVLFHHLPTFDFDPTTMVWKGSGRDSSPTQPLGKFSLLKNHISLLCLNKDWRKRCYAVDVLTVDLPFLYLTLPEFGSPVGVTLKNDESTFLFKPFEHIRRYPINTLGQSQLDPNQWDDQSVPLSYLQRHHRSSLLEQHEKHLPQRLYSSTEFAQIGKDFRALPATMHNAHGTPVPFRPPHFPYTVSLQEIEREKLVPHRVEQQLTPNQRAKFLEIFPKEYISALLTLLGDQVYRVRLAACAGVARIVGMVPDNWIVDTLLPLIGILRNDGNYQIRLTFLIVLEHVSLYVSPNILETFIIPTVSHMLTDYSSSVRIKTLETLKFVLEQYHITTGRESSHKQAVKALFENAQENDTDRTVMQVAAYHLCDFQPISLQT
ncbi:hypothetical protein BLNAU_2807 [Blattamonas nauphoetae]|uniref:Uncharacterized protein n=1 Tax=Blattamonas nauphoetae TaxID=2049346 RepID=A0ABQ9YEE8_9EUKA|nr:hypothetical protein BLNAU_2807 [Blattamonas nauphoetae]